MARRRPQRESHRGPFVFHAREPLAGRALPPVAAAEVHTTRGGLLALTARRSLSFGFSMRPPPLKGRSTHPPPLLALPIHSLRRLLLSFFYSRALVVLDISLATVDAQGSQKGAIYGNCRVKWSDGPILFCLHVRPCRWVRTPKTGMGRFVTTRAYSDLVEARVMIL